MYIKRIKVCGFRTYRTETVFDFTPGINCIVGFNGSGKSNILKALEFVLSDTQEWGRIYLHEGIGVEVKRCYVEVVFDRTDDTYSDRLDKDTVAIRKIIDGSKHLILVNGKVITKEQYEEMLENYGVCVSNLYNIIKQGEIVKMSSMGDETILLHLKNILGAKKFEEKKEDAIRMLTSYDCRVHKTEKDFDDLRHRIDQLKKDNERYLMYEKLETERKQLEYNLTKLRLQHLLKDSERAKKKVAILSEQAEAADAELCNYIDKKTSFMEEIRKLKLEIVSSENALDVQMSEEIQNERNIVHTQILLEEKREEKQKAVNEDKQRFAERQQINEYISVVNEKITLFRRAIAAKDATMRSKKDDIDKMLSANKNRENTNKEEAVANIKKLEAMVKDMDIEIEDVEHEILKTLQLLERLEEVYNSLLAESRRNAALSGKCDDRIKALNDQAEEYVEKKRQKQQEIASLTTRLNTVKGQRMEAKEKYEGLLKSSQKEIKRLLEMIWEEPSINNENVYGLLIDNVKVDKKYVTAVDAILEHHYFVLIVKDAQTAKAVINFIDMKREEKPTGKEEDDVLKPEYYRNFIFGRISIVPMDRIKIYKRQDYPDDEDIVPLIDCVEYDEKISNYMKQILYKTILVKSLDSCECYYSEKYTCVDLDGDYISGTGYISGGYKKRKYSMYGINAKVKNLKEEEESIKKQIEECYDCIEKLDDQVRENYDKRAIVLAQKNGCDTRLSSLENTGKSNEEYIRVTDMKLTGLKAKKKGLEDYKKKIKDQISALKEEWGNNANKGKGRVKEGKGGNHVEMENEEDDHLNILTDEVKKLKDEILHLQHKQDEYKNKLELLYNKKLESDSYIYFSDAGDADIKEYEKRLKEKEELREVINEKKKSIEKHIEDITIGKEKLKKEVEKILVAEKKQKKKILDLCHQMNALNSEIRAFDMKESELRDKKSNLEQGTDDENTMQYRHLNVAQLSARLKAVTSELKQYMNVNAKIGVKLHQLVKDYTNLKTRKADLKCSYQGIMNMIVNIEKRKNDLLEQNFEKINNYFSEFFSTLFNNKKAHLVLNKMTEEEYRIALEQEDSNKMENEFIDAPYVNKIIGISVKVFSTEEETRLYAVQELSGGERSIVVLCLLLALNKVDNCSFFFFDEVDAALDTIHRTSLAILLRDLASKGTQFIINTFRKELLEYCDNFYIVKSINRESLANKGTKEQAYDIISLEERRVAV